MSCSVLVSEMYIGVNKTIGQSTMYWLWDNSEVLYTVNFNIKDLTIYDCGNFLKSDSSVHCHDYNTRAYLCQVRPNCTYYDEGRCWYSSH